MGRQTAEYGGVLMWGFDIVNGWNIMQWVCMWSFYAIGGKSAWFISLISVCLDLNSAIEEILNLQDPNSQQQGFYSGTVSTRFIPRHCIRIPIIGKIVIFQITKKKLETLTQLTTNLSVF